MYPNNNVYCPIPWNEVHINADGTYHTCGSQPNTISGTVLSIRYCIQNMSTQEWMRSDYQVQQRRDKINGVESSLCNMCYQEEKCGSSSKRKRELQKYAHELLFFDPNSLPEVDSYHISLGNECNLACRMCSPTASSKLAAERKHAGEWTGPVRLNWTDSESAWQSLLSSICSTKTLKFVHIIGGEPLLNKRFEELIDALIEHNLTDIYLGFTTNATIFNSTLLEKLGNFRHVDIGVSIECTGLLNEYIRLGSSTEDVLNNIDSYLKYRKESHVYITLRPAPSALSVHALKDLFLWAIDRKLDVMSNMLVDPDYMQIKQLPDTIKVRLLEYYSDWEYSEVIDKPNRNSRDPNDYKLHYDAEIKAIINLLQQKNDPDKTQELYSRLKSWKWFDNPEIATYFKLP